MKIIIQKYGVYAIGVVVVILFVIGLLQEPEASNAEISPNYSEYEQNIEKTYIYIDVKGAVKNPGVYKLESDSRLFQVIQLAGGLREDADQNAINFSVILKDQDVVYVPTYDEEYPNISTSIDSQIGGVININTATLEQLESLPGIGPSTAQKIIDYRTDNGSFVAIEDIMNVSGIGETTFAEIKDLITV